MNWSLTIGRIAGTNIRLHVTFLSFLAWIGIADYPAGGPSAAVEAIVFILCVTLHEFGHIAMARRCGANRPEVILPPSAGPLATAIAPRLTTLAALDHARMTERFLLATRHERHTDRLQSRGGGGATAAGCCGLCPPPRSDQRNLNLAGGARAPPAGYSRNQDAARIATGGLAVGGRCDDGWPRRDAGQCRSNEPAGALQSGCKATKRAETNEDRVLGPGQIRISGMPLDRRAAGSGGAA